MQCHPEIHRIYANVKLYSHGVPSEKYGHPVLIWQVKTYFD